MEDTKTQETTFEDINTTSSMGTTIDVENLQRALNQAKENDLKELDIQTPQQFTNDQLLPALYYVWDAFDRCNVPYFLVNKTAEDAIANRELSGDCIEVGIRRNEWVSGGRRLLDTFLGQPIEETPFLATYKHEGVPILLYNYEDHDCIVQTDMIHYANEEFKVPNPYETFKKLYD